MNPPDKAAHPFQRRGVLDLGRAPAAARVDRETKAAKGSDGAFSVQQQRRDDGYLELGELGNEGMLLGDLSIAPSSRPVKLCDDPRRRRRQRGAGSALFEPYLVDPI